MLLRVSFGSVGSWSFSALNRGLQNLGTFQKDLIWFVRGCCLCALFRGLQNLDAPCKGDVFTFFLRRAKRTKKHARGLRTSGLRGRFKALPEFTLQKLSAARIETGFAHKTAAKRR